MRAISNDSIILVISTAQFFIYIASIVFFLRWFKNAYQNISKLGFKLKYSKNMSVGAWFIPFFHWVGPIQMILEIYRKAEEILIENSNTAKNKSLYIVITIWWSLYVLSGAESLFKIIALSINSNRFLDTFESKEYFICNSIFQMTLTLMVIFVIINYRKLETQLANLSFITESKLKETEGTIDTELIDF